jgi:hypothetical protein
MSKKITEAGGKLMKTELTLPPVAVGFLLGLIFEF